MFSSHETNPFIRPCNFYSSNHFSIITFNFIANVIFIRSRHTSIFCKFDKCLCIIIKQKLLNCIPSIINCGHRCSSVRISIYRNRQCKVIHVAHTYRRYRYKLIRELHQVIESPKSIPFLLIFICSMFLFVIEDSTNRNNAFRFEFRCKNSRINCQMCIRTSRNPTAEYGSREHKIDISKMCLVIYGFYNHLPVSKSKIVLH